MSCAAFGAVLGLAEPEWCSVCSGFMHRSHIAFAYWVLIRIWGKKTNPFTEVQTWRDHERSLVLSAWFGGRIIYTHTPSLSAYQAYLLFSESPVPRVPRCLFSCGCSSCSLEFSLSLRTQNNIPHFRWIKIISCNLYTTPFSMLWRLPNDTCLLCNSIESSWIVLNLSTITLLRL